MAASGDSLESWLNKATDPSNRQEDWECITGFCDQINKELEGPQIAARLLVHKVHSPQEWEALQALMVLEACMKNCGQRFQNEVGKFRFLNELIKVISPKYLGDKVSVKLKSKVIEMIYGWTIYLPEETKICEAYQMLKSQGIVLADPEISLDAKFVPPSPSQQPKSPVFDDEHKSRVRATVLNNFTPGMFEHGISALSSPSSSVSFYPYDIKFTPIFPLSSKPGDILQANDDLTSIINSCKEIVESQSINGVTKTPSAVKRGTSCTPRTESLIDLTTDVDISAFSQLREKDSTSNVISHVDLLCGTAVAVPSPASSDKVPASFSLLDEELLTLDSPGTVATESVLPTSINKSLQPFQNYNQDMDLLDTTAKIRPADPMSNLALGLATPLSSSSTLQTRIGPVQSASVPVDSPWSATAVTFPQSFADAQLSPLAPSLLDQSQQNLALLDLGGNKSIPGVHFDNTKAKHGSLCSPANLLHQEAVPVTLGCPPARSLSNNNQTSLNGLDETSLADLFVPLHAVKPSKICPVTAYDRGGVRLLLHFASDCPPGRSDVLVIVASMLNTSPLPVKDIVLQAAVPKTMKVKLQPPSGTHLAPFNPILPPAVITQVVLLANPHKEKVRMRYKLTFTLDEQPYTDVGEVNEFPLPDRLGRGL
ncbi:ADP-ribosylation factor-binding protein GGA3a [Hippocampus comes]|uniref:ADP-ribosylation factor-binding protein GGA3a n=1 Tax=Hippocampus comes TaxID=109280 RepID=UPI00094E7FAF|nr:PREDICTED: ADP-ribosylation factor-binding protein GGA3-like [Hippocampus comes]